MLLAALHCSSHVLGEGLAHTSSASSTAAAAGAHQSWPAEEQTPPHPDHGSACDAPGLTPPTQSRTPSTAVAEGKEGQSAKVSSPACAGARNSSEADPPIAP
ncbi:hypothetical protein, partial [Streptomyces sp. NPDC048340]|uniref:hypothetical protein n=1 Tax=Streptomyces sp. NPDC048340 TaxID=3365537 RepID=UPI00370FD5E7